MAALGAALAAATMGASSCGTDNGSTQDNNGTVPQSGEQQPKSATKGKKYHFSGNGGENLGTIKVPVQAVLSWTNDGDLMQILTDGPDPVPVNSQSHSGKTILQPGDYPNFKVNSIGNWDIRIKPNPSGG